MRAKLQCAAGKIEDGAVVEIVGKAEETANAEPGEGASPRSTSPEYVLRDDEGREETVNTRDFEALV
jgi:hypothetical protein